MANRKTVADVLEAVQQLDEKVILLSEKVQQLDEDVRPVITTFQSMRRLLLGILGIGATILIERGVTTYLGW